MSFDNLTFGDATLPKITRTRETGPNPFSGVMSESYAEKKGRSFSVPGGQAQKAVSKLRSAASGMSLGVRIVVLNSKGEQLTPAEIKGLAEQKSTAKVTVMFQAQEKRKYSERKK